MISWGISLVVLIGAAGARVEKIADPEQERLLARRGDGKNVLVIGGAGYIRSALLPKLLEAGYRVQLLTCCWRYRPMHGAIARIWRSCKGTSGTWEDREVMQG